MGFDFSLNSSPEVKVVYIGEEKQPVVVADNFLQCPQDLVALAGDGASFSKNKQDFYPGHRKPIPPEYAQQLISTTSSLLRQVFSFDTELVPQVSLCALSLVTTPPQQLLPIQRIPHFDTSEANQLAVVHYLCSPEQGGTSFYRHRKTGFESIPNERFKLYTSALEQEAADQGLPNAEYINGDSRLFQKIETFSAKFNRAIFYRSNVLHSGNIQAQLGLSQNPKEGRLTANTFIRFNRS